MNTEKIVSKKVIYEALYVLRATFPEKAKEYEDQIISALCNGFDLSVLRLSRRTETILRGNGITNTVKLTRGIINDLYRLNGIGKKRLEEIIQKDREFHCAK